MKSHRDNFEPQNNSKAIKNKKYIHLKENSKASDVKTIKVSDKKQQKQHPETRSNINTSNIRGSKCYSQVGCKSEVDSFVIHINYDKKTEHEKEGSNSINSKIEKQLEIQQLKRDGRNQQLNLRTSDTAKVKISSRYRKLIDTNHINIQNKQSLSQINNSKEVQKQEHVYQQIANQVKLNNLQSKIMIDIPAVTLQKEEHVLHKLIQEQSFMVPTPEKERSCKLNIITPLSYQNLDLKKSLENKNTLLIKEKQLQKHHQKSVLHIDSQQEQAINKSINKHFAEVLQQIAPTLSASRQVEISLNLNEGPNSDQNQYINNIKSTKPKKSNHDVNRQNKFKMELLSHVIYYKIQAEQQHLSPAPAVLESEIVQLRKTVKQLRLQKVKATAEKQYLQESQVRFVRSEVKSNNQKQSIMSFRNCSETDKNSDISNYQPIYFGRIRKNKSANKTKAESMIPLEAQECKLPINFTKLKQKTQEKNIKNTQRSRPRQWRYSQQLSQKGNITIDLERIKEEKIEGSRQNINQSKQIQFEYPYAKTTEIRSKIMNKFESDEKKFHKFMIRQQTKARYFNQKLIQDKMSQQQSKNTKINSTNTVKPYENFEGSIIKNITKPLSRSFQKSTNSLSDLLFMNQNILKLIQQSQKKKSIKKLIQFSKLTIPQFPGPPTPKTSTDQLMELILELLPYSNQVYENQLIGCSLRKYKNCIMFQLPDNKRFKIIWHYSGKLYVGGWDQNKNQKSGEGFEFSPNKFYYKGQFSSNKKYGKGILIYANGSIYQGDFIDGQKHGKGKYFDSVNKSFYEGGWGNDKMHGYGYLQYQNDIYDGQFKEDEKSGFGIQHFGSGDRYFGEYEGDKFMGQGKYVWADEAVYIGHFKDNYRHNFGKWISSSSPPEIYIGLYTKGQKHGSGKYFWGNGCIYDGNFDNDLKHGIGTMQYPDGRWLQGVWDYGVLTKVLSKLAQTNYEESLQQPKSRKYQTHIRIKVIEKEQNY